MRCDGGVCDCENGYHLSFYRDATGSKVAACLSNESLGGLYKIEGKDAYADGYSCGNTLELFMMKTGTATVCVSLQ